MKRDVYKRQSVATIAKAVTIKGVQYQAYQVTARGNAAKARNLTGAFTLPILGNQKYQYTINANFACAVESSEVAQEEKKADTWAIPRAIRGKSDTLPNSSGRFRCSTRCKRAMWATAFCRRIPSI